MSKLTNNSVRDALMDSHGNISAAARSLGVTRQALQFRIEKNPELAQIVIDARESRVDIAEDKLGESLLLREAWAVCFTLKTLGKSRGYVEKQEVEVSGSQRLRVIEEVVTDVEFVGGESSTNPPAPETKPVP